MADMNYVAGAFFIPGTFAVWRKTLIFLLATPFFST